MCQTQSNKHNSLKTNKELIMPTQNELINSLLNLTFIKEILGDDPLPSCGNKKYLRIAKRIDEIFDAHPEYHNRINKQKGKKNRLWLSDRTICRFFNPENNGNPSADTFAILKLIILIKEKEEPLLPYQSHIKKYVGYWFMYYPEGNPKQITYNKSLITTIGRGQLHINKDLNCSLKKRYKLDEDTLYERKGYVYADKEYKSKDYLIINLTSKNKEKFTNLIIRTPNNELNIQD